MARKVRSKNAGPFWLTVDIFCGTEAAFARVVAVPDETFATVFGVSPEALRRFDIPGLNVVKVSLPRPQAQGSVEDRDMHGASWAALVTGIEVD